MSSFFKNAWKWLAILFAGIVAGMVAAIKLLDPKTVINAETYVKDQQQETKIGKLKQRGEGNDQAVDQSSEQGAAKNRKRSENNEGKSGRLNEKVSFRIRKRIRKFDLIFH